MKIIVMDSANVRVEVLDVADHMIGGDVEVFLAEHGYPLNHVSWMAAPVDHVPVRFHSYGIDGDNCREEVHTMRSARLKDFSVGGSVEEVKRREREELKEALTKYGKNVDGGYEVRFVDDCPVVAAYYCDDPCDMTVLTVRLDRDGRLHILCHEKNDDYTEAEIDPSEFFAGQLYFVTATIRNYGQNVD